MKALLALVMISAFLSPASAKPLRRFDDADADVRQANEELAEIQRKIDSGDIPKIQFDFDKADLRPESDQVIELIAGMMLKNPRLKLMILAPTRSVGSRDNNLKLSQARAKAVKEALVKLGIPPPYVRFRGMAFDEPVADNRTEEGRELNRRVEFHIMKRWWSSIY